jgi:hypothetical protein
MKRLVAALTIAVAIAVLPTLSQVATAATCYTTYTKYQTALCRYAIHYYTVCINPPYAPYYIDLGWSYGANC